MTLEYSLRHLQPIDYWTTMPTMPDDRPSPGMDYLTVPQAAEALGISQDALRKRVARGTIPHEKHADGRVWVYVDTSETGMDNDQDADQDSILVASLQDQIRFLREELQRKDAILLSLTERIPELEAAKEEEPERRSWWQRMFGG